MCDPCSQKTLDIKQEIVKSQNETLSTIKDKIMTFLDNDSLHAYTDLEIKDYIKNGINTVDVGWPEHEQMIVNHLRELVESDKIECRKCELDHNTYFAFKNSK